MPVSGCWQAADEGRGNGEGRGAVLQGRTPGLWEDPGSSQRSLVMSGDGRRWAGWDSDRRRGVCWDHQD